MQESKSFITDQNKTLATFMKPQTTEQQIPQMSKIGNQQIPKKLIDKLLKQQENHPTPRATAPKKSQSKKSDNDVAKEDLIIKIMNYQNSGRFGALLKKNLKINFTREQLTKKSQSQLEAVMYRIRTYLNTRHMEGIYEQMVRTTANGYESIVTNFGYDIEGFSDLLLNNPAFWDAFEMWKLERKLPDVPPSLQLLYIISSTTVVANMKNRHKAVSRTERIDNKKEKDEKTKQVKTKKQDDVKQQQERKKSQLKVGEILI